MAIIMEEVKKCICERCEHKWEPRYDETPAVCPKCRSPRWQTPPKPRKQKEGK